jgi:hypothetical protein
MATPTPTTWTLRLKSHRTTVFLHIDPLTPFATIKETLHAALAETGLTPFEGGPPIALPSSASSIQLGRPADPLDASQGFVLGEWESAPSDDEVAIEDEDEGTGTGKGKGKGRAAASSASATAKGKGKGGRSERAGDYYCPKGAGLRDGAVLAFRWEGDGTDKDEASWGVHIARYEDAYGVQNEGDVGGRAEFDG